jgi:hypothetical protein
VQHSVSKPLYALHLRIECFIGHLKEQHRIANRYDKTASSFLGFVLIGCSRSWIRFVLRTYHADSFGIKLIIKRRCDVGALERRTQNRTGMAASNTELSLTVGSNSTSGIQAGTVSSHSFSLTDIRSLLSAFPRQSATLYLAVTVDQS